jgi:hypothetical protein
MNNLSWMAYLIAAIIIAIVAYFTFGRARSDANRGTGPVDPPR